jgi:excisionase family DNA binding protein
VTDALTNLEREIAATFAAEEEARRRRAVLENVRDELRLARKIEGAGDWLSTADAAQRLGMKPDTVRWLVREGKIESRGRGKRILVSISSLRRYLVLKQTPLALNAR